MQRLLVNHQVITEVAIEDIATPPLHEGQARLTLESFALTANNVTYAASGFAIGYWKFFPTGIDGQGLVPVWGTATVTESRSDALAIGTRLYGFYPLAEELVIEPRKSQSGTIEDIAAHRAGLPAVYNRYLPVGETAPDEDHMRALLQPLLATSWLLADWLRDNAFFGAQQVIIGSASSKTGLGLCKFLAEDPDHPVRIVGLTSQGNRRFVEGLAACDQVLGYDQVSDIEKVPSVYVDMAGNTEVKHALHAALADHLKHSAAVGLSHWDKFAAKTELPGIKPQFFFAPAQIAKRRDDWGPGAVEQKINDAWRRVATGASDWMAVRMHTGLDAAMTTYLDLAKGKANPADGHVVRLDKG